MEGYTLIRCGALFDGSAQEVKEGWNILIKEGVIVEAGPQAACPQGAEIVDLSGLFVTPGLIDAHVHAEFFDWRNIYSDFASFTDEWLALGALHTAQQALLGGFTTLRVLGTFSRGFGLADVKRAIAAGYFDAARLYISPHGLSVTGGHGDLSKSIHQNPAVSGLLQSHGVGSGADFFAECVRREVKYGADFIKILASHSFGGPDGCDERLEFTGPELKAILEAAYALRIPVTAHAYTPGLMRRLAEEGVSGIEHGSMMDKETAKILESAGVYVVTTFSPLDDSLYGDENDQSLSEQTRHRIRHYGKRLREGRQALLESGLTLGFGSDHVSKYQSYESWREYASWVKSGASPLRALKAATSVNAGIIGASDIGKIAPGMRADIAGWPPGLLKDPALMADCRFVMKDGKTIKTR